MLGGLQTPSRRCGEEKNLLGRGQDDTKFEIKATKIGGGAAVV
jgi:hypothetical protein